MNLQLSGVIELLLRTIVVRSEWRFECLSMVVAATENTAKEEKIMITDDEEEIGEKKNEIF